MLTTQQEHELPTFPFAAGPGVTTWRAVTLHVGVTYVLVSYSIRHGGGWLPQTTIFWRHEDVLAFCKQVNKDRKRKLVEVFMLVPLMQKAGNSWSFVPVREIFVGPEDESGSDFPLYVMADGEVVGGPGVGETHDITGRSPYETLEKVFPT